LACLNGLPRGDVESFVAAIASSNPWNPVEEWIASKPWDGTDRLPEVYATLTEAEGYPRQLKETLVRKWLLSAAAAALVRHGFRCRGVLTLQGPQGIGKTRWVASLVPDDELQTAVKIDQHLDANNKDTIIGAVAHWICEIGELDSSFSKDIARLKGVLTRDTDKVRKPYARAESEMPRRTVFVATVNEPRFLVDNTGNSRWWVLPVTAIDWQHCVDMQQVFAQLAHELRGGAEWWLTSEEERLLEEQNQGHRSVSMIEDLVLGALDLDRLGKPDLQAKTARELLQELGVHLPTNPQCKECAGVLRAHLGDPRRIQGRDKWRIPLAPSWGQENKAAPTPRVKNFD
jgi:putative DNA primase/helicase